MARAADRHLRTQNSIMALLKHLSLTQRVACGLAAVLYAGAGILHFAKPAPYLRIMPPYIPWPVLAVRLSGVLEIVGGLGLLLPNTRRAAAWALIALLIAVFPANIYMATHPTAAGAATIPAVWLWARLPVQPLLMLWLYWCTKPSLIFR